MAADNDIDTPEAEKPTRDQIAIALQKAQFVKGLAQELYLKSTHWYPCKITVSGSEQNTEMDCIVMAPDKCFALAEDFLVEIEKRAEAIRKMIEAAGIDAQPNLITDIGDSRHRH